MQPYLKNRIEKNKVENRPFNPQEREIRALKLAAAIKIQLLVRGNAAKNQLIKLKAVKANKIKNAQQLSVTTLAIVSTAVASCLGAKKDIANLCAASVYFRTMEFNKGISTLDLRHIKSKPQLIKIINAHPNLESLDLSRNNNVDNDVLAAIANCTSLQTLDLCYTRVTEENVNLLETRNQGLTIYR